MNKIRKEHEENFFFTKSHKTLGKLRDHFTEYCSHTSIAGFRYITEDNRPWYERVLWAVGIAVGFGVFVNLAYNAWSRWAASPVFVAMGERLHPVWQIPFPAVTVCPFARIDSTKYNLSEALHNYDSLSDEQKQILADITLQCLKKTTSRQNFRTNEAIDRIESVSVSHLITIGDVSFGLLGIENTLFQPLLTEDGACYTFNMLPNEELFRNDTFHASRNYLRYENVDLQWTFEHGYTSSARVDSYPFRSLHSGTEGAMSVELRTLTRDMDNYCTYSIEGFEVMLHNPWEFPQMNEHSFFVPLNSLVHVAVMPQTITTSDELRRNYSPAQRQCYFPDERRLRYFRHYTRSNCEFECLANVTFHMCQCVAFYMPRKTDTAICSGKNIECVNEAAYKFQLSKSGMEEDLKAYNLSEDKMEKLSLQCDCLQSCSFASYQTERSLANYNFRKTILFLNNSEELRQQLEEIQISQLVIFYKESHFIPYQRMELYAIGSFIANCGGLLGLCLGMSYLSILELLYWLLVRPFWGPKKIPPQPSEIKTLSMPAVERANESQHYGSLYMY